MSSPDHQLSVPPSLEVVDATNGIIVDVDAIPFDASTGEKRRRVRSRVWQHFTRLERKLGEREECQCNHCGHLYVCSSRSGTAHLNRHIFDGGCPKYRESLGDSEIPASRAKDEADDSVKTIPRKAGQYCMRNFTEQANRDSMEAQLAELKDENAKLQRERDAAIAEKTNLEQLIINMAAETARLTEENNQLKEERVRLKEENKRIVTREEFTRLETEVSKIKDILEKEKRGFPAAALAALAAIQKNR